MRRHVVIGLPAYTGMLHLSTNRSLTHDILVLARRGDVVTLIDDVGGAYICDIRAYQLAQFRGIPGATDLVFVDNDVCWQASALPRLLDYPVDVVAGVYPKRQDPITYAIEFLPDQTERWADPETGLLEVAGVTAGFLHITRTAADRMVEAYSDLVFDVHPNDAGQQRAPNNEAWDVFGTYRPKDNPRRKLQDDYAFCARWRDIGGKVWIDPDIMMGHTGLKTFSGALGKWLKSDRSNNAV